MKFTELRQAYIPEETFDMACTKGILTAIAAVETGETIDLDLDDGSVVEMTPELAESLLAVYDQLDEDNADKFQVLLSASQDSFVIAQTFCEECLDLEEGSGGTKRQDRIMKSAMKPDSKMPTNVVTKASQHSMNKEVARKEKNRSKALDEGMITNGLSKVVKTVGKGALKANRALNRTGHKILQKVPVVGPAASNAIHKADRAVNQAAFNTFKKMRKKGSN